MPYFEKWEKEHQEKNKASNHKLDSFLSFFKAEGKKRGNSELFQGMEKALGRFNEQAGKPVKQDFAMNFVEAGEELERACDAYLKAKKGAWTSKGRKRLEMAANMKQFIQEQNLDQVRDVRLVNYMYGGMGGRNSWKNQIPFRLVKAVLPTGKKEAQGDLKGSQRVEFTDHQKNDREGYFVEADSLQEQEHARKNMAATRIAEYLQEGHLFAHWEKMEADSDGREKSGYFMEAPDGVSAAWGDEAARKRLNEAKEAQPMESYERQMAALKVIDYLCGQTERKPENITYKLEQENSTGKWRMAGIQVLDTGSSFGENMGKSSESADLKGIGRIPDDLAGRISRLEEKQMRFLLKDLVTENQLQAVLTRAGQLKQHIKENRLQADRGKNRISLNFNQLAGETPAKKGRNETSQEKTSALNEKKASEKKAAGFGKRG